MTVAEMIEALRAFPADWPVQLWMGDREYREIEGVRQRIERGNPAHKLNAVAIDFTD